VSESPLRQALEAAAAETGCSLKALTVLATQNDPFRLDTPAGHRDGEWLAITARDLGVGARRFHLRGFHYMVIDRPKPDGTPYQNNEKDWDWLQNGAAKAARFLGYVPWEQVIDNRNAEPEIREFSKQPATAYLTTELDVQIPSAWELEPTVTVVGYNGVQPYHLVMVGEKSSLGDVLGPVAREVRADLYLPTGEPSDTMLYTMAETATTDGRDMVVFYFSDCDPSGHGMPISVSRKLQAFKVLFPEMPEFEVHRVALTPDQVREYGLPSTPLKDTEKRASRWTAATGVEQTEIDALASLEPALLRQIAREAVRPFFDYTLDHRVIEAKARWRDAAQEAVNEAADAQLMESIREQAARQLDEMREQIAALNDSLHIDPGDIDLPPFDIPAAELNGHHPQEPLLDSRWDFAEQCRRLIDSKAYEVNRTKRDEADRPG
jgi:hypothetical protein